MEKGIRKKRLKRNLRRNTNAQGVALNGNFSFDTIENFDKHIDLSILGYINLQKTILNISSYFIKPQSNVYDIGCSTGLMLNYLDEKIGDNSVRYFGVDITDNLLGKNCPDKANVVFEKENVCSEDFLMKKTSFVISVFTLQFLPVHKRANVLKKIFDSLNQGGAFIISEKTYIGDGQIQDIFTFSYYDYKQESFSPDHILSKQNDLRKIMNPVSQEEIEESLKQAGFKKVCKFWQSLQFNGWLCIK
jgi:tRNA (cmo5U34)-methyltransferase